MFIVRVWTPLRPTPAPSTANRSERRQPGKKVQLKLDALLCAPPSPPPLISERLCSSVVNLAPPKQACHGSVVLLGAGGGGVPLAIFSRGYGDTVTRRWVLIKGGAGGRSLEIILFLFVALVPLCPRSSYQLTTLSCRGTVMRHHSTHSAHM